jgi:hypothetical protein
LLLALLVWFCIFVLRIDHGLDYRPLFGPWLRLLHLTFMWQRSPQASHSSRSPPRIATAQWRPHGASTLQVPSPSLNKRPRTALEPREVLLFRFLGAIAACCIRLSRVGACYALEEYHHLELSDLSAIDWSQIESMAMRTSDEPCEGWM